MNQIPTITKMEVFPVAGHDCMELNLSGAHAPYFTRNIVILTDSTGNEGIGEVPGGEKITAALEQIKDLYTEEAYLLCKRLEFKNMLGRFEVDAPKNQAEEHFKLVTEKKEAEKIFAKIKGIECAFQIQFDEGGKRCDMDAGGR